MLNTLTSPHEYPGKLFVVEGVDGSGKTTQIALLAKWLSAAGHRVFLTEWNSSALVKAATRAGKKKNALSRDVARGVDRQWVRDLYSFAVKPDLALYFRVPIEVSIERLMARRVKLKFYEAGLDMGWSTNPVESFRLFQGKVIEEYDRLVDEYGLQVLNAAATITEQQHLVRQLVARELESSDEAVVATV
jgi:dTMP kinase